MNTKLTLTIDQETIVKAKKYARNKKRSLSDIVENYLRVITREHNKERNESAPVVKSLKGAFNAPRDFDYKKELQKRLTEKYM